MTWLIATAATVAYLTAGMFIARWLYGHWRARSIDKEVSRPYSLGLKRSVEFWNEIERGPVMAGALGCGLIWPLVAIIAPLGILIAHFMTSTPILSQAELKDRLAERDRRITQLEREAGIRP